MSLGLDSEGEQDRSLHGPGHLSRVLCLLVLCSTWETPGSMCRPPLSSETCHVLFPPTGTRNGYLLCPAGIFHSVPPAPGLEQLGVPSQVHCPALFLPWLLSARPAHPSSQDVARSTVWPCVQCHLSPPVIIPMCRSVLLAMPVETKRGRRNFWNWSSEQGVSHHVHTENQIQVLCKHNKYS